MVHGAAALTMLVAFIQGLIPAISSFNILFTGLECVVVAMCQVGLVFFGMLTYVFLFFSIILFFSLFYFFNLYSRD